jgi:hypothetical protein
LGVRVIEKVGVDLVAEFAGEAAEDVDCDLPSTLLEIDKRDSRWRWRDS